jgi:hypothetical protein
MATWFEITYTGQPTEDDYERVSEMAAEGYTSGQLINDSEPGTGTGVPDYQGRAMRAAMDTLGDLYSAAIDRLNADEQHAISIVREVLSREVDRERGS